MASGTEGVLHEARGLDVGGGLRSALQATDGALGGLGAGLGGLASHIVNEEDVTDVYYRIIVLGALSSGKSSIIKRLVCKRFDNLPTYNSHFMGMPADGRHVVRTTMPANHAPMLRKGGSTADDAERDVMVELQDKVANLTERSLLTDEPLWYKFRPRSLSAAPSRGSALKAAAAPAAAGEPSFQGSSFNSLDTPPSDARKVTMAADQAAAAAAPAAEQARLRGKVRTGMPPDRDPHPLMGHQIESKKRETAARLNKGNGRGDASDKPNPIEQRHGAKGWIVAFDLSSQSSFAEGCAKVATLMERLGHAPETRRQCPVVVLLVGNKADLGARRQVEPDAVADELLKYVQGGGAFMSQLKKQRLASALLRCVEKAVHYKRSALEIQADRSQPGRSTMGDEISVERYKALQRLRNELDPLHVSASHCTDADAVRGAVCALRHCGMLRSELFEQLLLCPAVGLKYVEVSCRTNLDVPKLERMLLLSLRHLPSLEAIRGGTGKRGKKGRGSAAASELLEKIGLGGVGGLDFIFDALPSWLGGGGDAAGRRGSAAARGGGISAALQGGGLPGAARDDDDDDDDEGEEGEDYDDDD